MPTDTSQNTTDQPTRLGAIASRGFPLAVAIGLVGLGLAVGLAVKDDTLRYFFHSYLLNYCYFLSISLGALFFVALQHATRAGWSVTVRRLAEVLAANFFCLLVLFLPIVVPVLLGNSSLYVWNDAEAVAHQELLQHKAVYLNPTFFGIRCVVYFLVWWYLGRFFLQRSLAQDESGDPALTVQMERLSPVALLLFAATITFASFDWLMSLEPTWFSTIYGVYYFSGAAVAFFAVIILAAMLLQTTGRLTREITTEHYHDLGKLLFAFVVFWGYIAFSQYLLIWYANIPEETEWYQARQTGSWVSVSVALLFVHLLIPFFGLLSREVKRRRILLEFWAVWLLAAHWLDLYYLVMPSYDHAAAPLGLIDLGCFLGIGGIYTAGILRVAGQRSLVPRKDPRLEESLKFENV